MKSDLDTLEVHLAEQRQRENSVGWAALVSVGALLVATGMLIRDVAKATFKQARAMLGRQQVGEIWGEFEDKIGMAQPARDSRAVEYPSAVAEVRGPEMSRSSALAPRVPKDMVRIFEKFGLSPKVLVWASGMQSTTEGIEFSGASFRQPGIGISDLGEFKYLARSIGRSFCSSHQSLVTSIIQDGKGALLEGRLADPFRKAELAEWQAACRFLGGWTARLDMGEDAEFFKGLLAVSRLSRPMFEQFLSVEKKVQRVAEFPFAVDRKLDEMLAVYESLVVTLEDLKDKDPQRAICKRHLAGVGRRVDVALSRLADVESRYLPSLKGSSMSSSIDNHSDSDFFAALDRRPEGAAVSVASDLFGPISRAFAICGQLKERVDRVTVS